MSVGREIRRDLRVDAVEGGQVAVVVHRERRAVLPWVSTPGIGAFYTIGMRPICFLSDFGLADDFVGTCKGVMLRFAPGLSIVDLTHEVPGFAVETGAEILQHATRYMPADTVYLAVIDPGVGTERRELALLTESGAMLVGPDNGLLVQAAESLGGISGAVALTEESYHLHPVSNTFHGRDVFAPVAAHLAAGVELWDLGEVVDSSSLERLSPPSSSSGGGEGFETSIISIDRFGNARLSVMQEESGLEYGDALKIDAGDGEMSVRYVETFGSARAGELVLVPDSHWHLSLAINKGSAAHALTLEIGGKVRIGPPTDSPGDAGA
jgi:S-adenosyl-L-methionine hydrolase (adenosine-forming)